MGAAVDHQGVKVLERVVVGEDRAPRVVGAPTLTIQALLVGKRSDPRVQVIVAHEPNRQLVVARLPHVLERSRQDRPRAQDGRQRRGG